jgi:hypothetical protein
VHDAAAIEGFGLPPHHVLVHADVANEENVHGGLIIAIREPGGKARGGG